MALRLGFRDLEPLLFRLGHGFCVLKQAVRDSIRLRHGLRERILQRNTGQELLRGPAAFPLRQHERPAVVPAPPGLAQGVWRRQGPASGDSSELGLDALDPLLSFENLGRFGLDVPSDSIHRVADTPNRGLAGRRQVRSRAQILRRPRQAPVPLGRFPGQAPGLALRRDQCAVRLHRPGGAGQGGPQRRQVRLRQGLQLVFPGRDSGRKLPDLGGVGFLPRRCQLQPTGRLLAPESGSAAQAQCFDGFRSTFEPQILHACAQRGGDASQLGFPVGPGFLVVAIATEFLVQPVHGRGFFQDRW